MGAPMPALFVSVCDVLRMQRLKNFSIIQNYIEIFFNLIMLNKVIYLIMSNVKERILRFIQSSNISTAEFERSIGVSGGYVSNISKSIQPDKLEIISNIYPSLNIEWLLIGRGSMLKSEQISSIKERLAHFLKKEKISIPDFCKSIGMYQAAYLEMRGSIPESKLKNIMTKYPQLSIEWLMTGEGKMIKTIDVQSEGDAASTQDSIQSSDDLTLIEELKTENAALKEEILLLRGENRILRELNGLGERKDSNKIA